MVGCKARQAFRVQFLNHKKTASQVKTKCLGFQYLGWEPPILISLFYSISTSSVSTLNKSTVLVIITEAGVAASALYEEHLYDKCTISFMNKKGKLENYRMQKCLTNVLDLSIWQMFQPQFYFQGISSFIHSLLLVFPHHSFWEGLIQNLLCPVLSLCYEKPTNQTTSQNK